MRGLLLRISVGAVLVLGCTAVFAETQAPEKRQALWTIVHDRCVPGQIDKNDPAPCAAVVLPNGDPAQGHVVLKDRKGDAQYLVMPTELISGIEDSHVLALETPNYFTYAWQAKALVEERLGKKLAREDVSIAVNSAYGRTQDLLHLHVDCVRTDVREALHVALPKIGYHWSRKPIALGSHHYYTLRLDGEDSLKASPFRLLAQGLHVKAKDMGAWTLVVTGAHFADGKNGFVLLADKANTALGNVGSGEELQDHDCKLRNE
jgi:CDP-diacylglycerol pyrophosphatase